MPPVLWTPLIVRYWSERLACYGPLAWKSRLSLLGESHDDQPFVDVLCVDCPRIDDWLVIAHRTWRDR